MLDGKLKVHGRDSLLGLAESPVYTSDLSEVAANAAVANGRRHGVQVDARSGSLFEPWKGMTFDTILDDVSGVAAEAAAASTWFKGVPCDADVDGTALINQVIEQAPAHLNKGGRLFFPVISLSNQEKIVSKAKIVFSHVEEVSHQEWPLPKEMLGAVPVLEKLQAQGHVKLEKKFGMVLFATDVFVAHD